MLYQTRIKQIQDSLDKQEALLVSSPSNIFYFCGFSGSYGFMIITSKSATLATDARYSIAAKALQFKGLKVQEVNSQWSDKLLKLTTDITTFFFEDNHLSVASLKRWKKTIKQKKWKSIGNRLSEQRNIKDTEEISYLSQAAKIGSKILKMALKDIKPGVTEWSIAQKLRELSYHCADGISFEPIVAFGSNTAVAHHKPSKTRLKKNDVILIDQGVLYKGYHSDMTRCFFNGKGIPFLKEKYELLLNVQKQMVKLVRPGVNIGDFCTTARALLQKDEKYFTHSLGHGVGIDIHEAPTVSYINTKTVLQEGVVITIEPGLYYPQIGGLRIEDTVIVRENGAEIITKSPKKLSFL